MTFRPVIGVLALLGIVWAAVAVWHPATAEAASACLLLRRGQYHDVLVNRCSACRIAKVQRWRPGGAAPVVRSVTVLGRSEVPLGFKGPGSTRVLSDSGCDGSAAPTTSDSTTTHCVRLEKLRNGVPVLVNACDVCRIAHIRRIHSDGSARMQDIGLGPRKAVPLASLGARLVQIAGENACR